MRLETDQLKKDGHIVSVFHDGKSVFIQMDGTFYQVRIDCDTEMRIINTDKPVTPIVSLEEMPKEYQPMFVGYD